MSTHPDAPDTNNVDVATQQQINEEMKKKNGTPEPKQVFVSKEDRLEAENLHLRVLNHAHEAQRLQQEIHAVQAKITGMQKEILETRSKLEKKYGINLQTHEIRETDGLVIPRTDQMQKAMAALGQR